MYNNNNNTNFCIKFVFSLCQIFDSKYAVLKTEFYLFDLLNKAMEMKQFIFLILHIFVTTLVCLLKYINSKLNLFLFPSMMVGSTPNFISISLSKYTKLVNLVYIYFFSPHLQRQIILSNPFKSSQADYLQVCWCVTKLEMMVGLMNGKDHGNTERMVYLHGKFQDLLKGGLNNTPILVKLLQISRIKKNAMEKIKFSYFTVKN